MTIDSLASAEPRSLVEKWKPLLVACSYAGFTELATA